MLDDLLRMMGAMTGAPSRVIARDELNNGLIVSTVDSADAGPETAILDAAGAYPVERYETDERAKAGHAKWKARAEAFKPGETITELGYGSSIDDCQVTLCVKGAATK